MAARRLFSREEQLAQNYWQNSRSAQTAGNGLKALHFGASAIRMEPMLLDAVLLDLRDIQPFALRQIVAHKRGSPAPEFSPDETRILTWSRDNTARLWEARTGHQISPALHHNGKVYGALFGRDESRILTWSRDNTARLWEARTGHQISPALHHNGKVYGALFGRDESRILTWSADSTARLWDARTGQPIGPALQHQSTVDGALFSRDESRILTWSADSTARIWILNADLDFPAEHVELWTEAMTGSELDVVTQEVKTLEPNRWREIRQRYEAIAADHAKTCKYPDANEWFREQKESGR